MTLSSTIIDEGIEELLEVIAVRRATQAGEQTATGMCGNEGQLTIIALMGNETFEKAANVGVESAQDGGGADAEQINGELVANCTHPEAVEIILVETSDVMADVIDAVLSGKEG